MMKLGSLTFLMSKLENSLHPISINLSRARLGDAKLVKHLTEIVDKYEVNNSLIDFELTESAAYDNQLNLVQVIKSLKEKGFKISMDDFDTGYSSLSLMTSIPMDTIKIDKSFIDRINCHDNYKDCAEPLAVKLSRDIIIQNLFLWNDTLR